MPITLDGTNGATFYITGVQLEVGSTATSFDYRPYGTELQLCQRYCPVLYPPTTGGASSTILGTAYTTTNARIVWVLPVSPRTPPTGIDYSTLTASYTNGSGSGQTLSSLGFIQAGYTTASIDANVTSGLTAGQGGWLNSNTGKIIFTGCEL